MSQAGHPGAGRDLLGLENCMSNKQLPRRTRSRITSGMTIKDDLRLLGYFRIVTKVRQKKRKNEKCITSHIFLIFYCHKDCFEIRLLPKCTQWGKGGDHARAKEFRHVSGTS